MIARAKILGCFCNICYALTKRALAHRFHHRLHCRRLHRRCLHHRRLHRRARLCKRNCDKRACLSRPLTRSAARSFCTRSHARKFAILCDSARAPRSEERSRAKHAARQCSDSCGTRVMLHFLGSPSIYEQSQREAGPRSYTSCGCWTRATYKYQLKDACLLLKMWGKKMLEDRHACACHFMTKMR